MFTMDTAGLPTTEGKAFAWGVQHAEDRFDHAESWTFGLAWALLHRLEASRAPIGHVYNEWRNTGRIAYTSRGRQRWITSTTRKGMTGMVTEALASEIGEGDVIITGPNVIVQVSDVSAPYQRGNRTLITAYGTNVLDDCIVEVDMTPDTEVEVTRIAEARAFATLRP